MDEGTRPIETNPLGWCLSFARLGVHPQVVEAWPERLLYIDRKPLAQTKGLNEREDPEIFLS